MVAEIFYWFFYNMVLYPLIMLSAYLLNNRKWFVLILIGGLGLLVVIGLLNLFKKIFKWSIDSSRVNLIDSAVKNLWRTLDIIFPPVNDSENL